jgi:hypothetical protein
MERVLDEAQYVLRNLCRMQDEVSAHPQDFDPDAQAQLAEAIARIQSVLRSTRSELTESNRWAKAA